MYDSPEERFKTKLYSSGNGCLEYEGAYSDFGHGRFRVHEGSEVRAHRYAWMMEKGEIPSGMQVLHRCDNPRCCNVEHLFLGTQLDNMQDKMAKGRDPDRKGINAGRAVLNDAKVLEILELNASGVSKAAIARKFGVAYTTIASICSGINWAHVYAEFTREK